MWRQRFFDALKIEPLQPRPQPHQLLAVYCGALSPAAALRLGLASSVQSAQEPPRE